MHDQWDYVIAAYAVTAAGTLGALVASWVAMRAAEARAARFDRAAPQSDAGNA